MEIITTFMVKGGVGKSTIADELAFFAERNDVSFSFLNLDKQQYDMHDNKQLDDSHVLIVDTPGEVDKQIVEVLKSSAVIVVPMLPNDRSLNVAKEVMKTLRVHGTKAKVFLVLNKFNERYKAHQQARSELRRLYGSHTILTLPSSTIAERAVFKDNRCSVVDIDRYAPMSKAMDSLCQRVMATALGLPKHAPINGNNI